MNVKWSLQAQIEPKCRPKCFWESALLNRILLKIILGWIFSVAFLLKITFWDCFVRSGLKLVLHWKSRLFISFRSLFKLLDVISSSLTVENSDVSSANNSGLQLRLSINHIMYIKSNKIFNTEVLKSNICDYYDA